MAIKIQKTTKQGIELNEAYVKFQEFRMDRESATLQFFIFASEQARLDNMQPIEVKSYNVRDTQFAEFFSLEELNTQNPIMLAYKYVKTLEEFASGLDC